jgi:hypothetical protein
VLRIETTINQPGQFRVYRRKQGEEQGAKAWRPLRKSVVDLHRRAEVSQQVNDRYEEALASLDTTQAVIDLVAPICRSIRREGVRYYRTSHLQSRRSHKPCGDRSWNTNYRRLPPSSGYHGKSSN